MNPKALIPLIAGLGIAGFAAKLGFDHLSQARGNTQTLTLWSVVQDVPRGEAVLEQYLRPIKFPAELAPQGALTDKEDIVGRVPHTGLPANVPVLESMLHAPGTAPGVHVPDGFRAVAVKINESSGVDNHLVPGCYVDVVGLFSVKVNNKNETIAKTILERVQVAAVGAQVAPEAPSPSESKNSRKSSRPTKPARAVTLLVRPEHVPVLHLAEQRGQIKLSMRGAGDSPSGNAVAERLITEEELLGLEDPLAEADEHADDEGQPETFANRVSQWFEQMMNPQAPLGPQADEEPEVAMVDPQRPQYTWIMTIYNGDEQRTLGFLPNRREPVLLSNDGPNVFEDEPQVPPPPPPPARAERGGQRERPQRVARGGHDRPRRTPIGYQPPTIPIPHQQPPAQPVEQGAEPNEPMTPESEGGELFE